MLQRLLLAWQFGDLNILISGSLTNDSRILFRRNIAERVQTLAPFLRLDNDPYLVIADGKLYWIQDAYTDDEPLPVFARRLPIGINYIRNSVKVVVDAYDGTTTFYVVDPNDPIIQTYAKIFPKLFKPLTRCRPACRLTCATRKTCSWRRSTPTAPTTSPTRACSTTRKTSGASRRRLRPGVEPPLGPTT